MFISFLTWGLIESDSLLWPTPSGELQGTAILLTSTMNLTQSAGHRLLNYVDVSTPISGQWTTHAFEWQLIGLTTQVRPLRKTLLSAGASEGKTDLFHVMDFQIKWLLLQITDQSL